MSVQTRRQQLERVTSAESMDHPLRGGLAHNTRKVDVPARKASTQPLTVTNVSQQILGEDPNRKVLFMQNNDPIGQVTVSAGGNAAVLGVGFVLRPGGGSILLDINCPQDKIFVIGSIANNPNVVVMSA